MADQLKIWQNEEKFPSSGRRCENVDSAGDCLPISHHKSQSGEDFQENHSHQYQRHSQTLSRIHELMSIACRQECRCPNSQESFILMYVFVTARGSGPGDHQMMAGARTDADHKLWDM